MSTVKSKMAVRAFIPLFAVFIVINLLLLLNIPLFGYFSIDRKVVLSGNLVLFAATGVSYYFYQRSLQNNNPHIFMRMVYAGMFIKMLLCLIATLLYVSTAAVQVNRGAIFACMFLYLLYTILEVAVIMKLSKQNRNA